MSDIQAVMGLGSGTALRLTRVLGISAAAQQGGDTQVK
jgi:hypothetical protein